MVRLRLLTFLITIVFVAIVGWAVSMFARGYRPDIRNLDILPTGLLVVTSVPDGAQIMINGELKSATNATISLAPNAYDVEVRKGGFLAWKKRLTIKKEEVTKADTILFPIAPSLSALTFTGAVKPVLSPNGTKIAYGIPQSQDKTVSSEQKGGLWVMELSDLPIGFSREPRQITDASVNQEDSWEWSPDSRELLLSSSSSISTSGSLASPSGKGKFLVSATSFTPQQNLVNATGKLLESTMEEWEKQEAKKHESAFSKLPKEVQEIILNKTGFFTFSPDSNKILYTASDSARIPENLITSLPGSSTQPEERGIKSGQTYVYDIKEDKNFLTTEELNGQKYTLYWFPTSNHIILARQESVTIMDYDGTNRQVVWSGPYEAPYAIPFPNTTRLLILTSLGSGNNNLPNLYALSLK